MENEDEHQKELSLEEPEVKLKPALQKVSDLFGITTEQFIEKVLTEHQSFKVDFTKKISQVLCKICPGGLWSWPDTIETSLSDQQRIGRYLKPNPHKKIRLMVICPHPGERSYEEERLPVYEMADIIEPILTNTNIEGDEVYCYYSVPFYPKKGKLLSPFITAFRPVLHEEIKRIRPEAILVLGSYSLKGLFGSKGMVGNFQGKSDQTFDGIPVHYTVDPYKMISSPKNKLSLNVDLARIVPLLGGKSMPWDKPQDYKDYQFIETSAELASVILDIVSEYLENDYQQGKPLRLAVDTEWGNPHGREGVKHDVVRYIQFSPKPHQAFTVALTDPELNPYPDRDEKIRILKSFLESDSVAIAGHNFKVDLIHLFELGIDCRKTFAFDTMTAYHFLKPQVESIGLTYCALEYTDLGNYESTLKDYIKVVKGLKKHTEKHGYSRIPDEILVGYSFRDVDAVSQIWPKIEASLLKNQIDERYAGYVIDGNRCYTQLDAYNNVVRKSDAGLFEPEYVGMPVDPELMVVLQNLYSEKKDTLRLEVERFTWPAVDPESTQVKAYLFGDKYSTKLLPDGIESLNLTPTQTTGKYPKPWDSLNEEERQSESPATSGDALALLSQAYPEHEELITSIANYKAINQVVKNFLRPPTVYEIEDGEQEKVYDSGLIGRVDEDLHIRGTYLATTETLRYRSLKPNLNNLPGVSAEPNIRKQFATGPELFEYPKWATCDSRELVQTGVIDPRYDVIRSCIRAPKEYVIVGADYQAAEIATVAYISGDEGLIAISEDPNRDVHSETAAAAFGIKVPEGELLADYIKANHNHARSSAKIVLFGLIYGRSAASLARQLTVAGVEGANKKYAEEVIEGIFNSYPKLREYMNRQRRAVYEPGYAENPFGTRRYFFDSTNGGVMSSQERASINFPIQSCVANVLQLAMGNFAKYKELYTYAPFHVMCPFHDAVYSIVHHTFAQEYAEKVVPWAMEEMAQVPSIGLKLKTDVEFEYHWSHPVSLEEAIAESLAG